MKAAHSVQRRSPRRRDDRVLPRGAKRTSRPPSSIRPRPSWAPQASRALGVRGSGSCHSLEPLIKTSRGCRFTSSSPASFGLSPSKAITPEVKMRARLSETARPRSEQHLLFTARRSAGATAPWPPGAWKSADAPFAISEAVLSQPEGSSGLSSTGCTREWQVPLPLSPRSRGQRLATVSPG